MSQRRKIFFAVYEFGLLPAGLDPAVRYLKAASAHPNIIALNPVRPLAWVAVAEDAAEEAAHHAPLALA